MIYSKHIDTLQAKWEASQRPAARITPYQAGLLAGGAEPQLVELDDGYKYLETPVCPFPVWRFVSYILWNEGFYKGLVERISNLGKVAL